MNSASNTFASGSSAAATSSMDVDMPTLPAAPTQLSFPPNTLEHSDELNLCRMGKASTKRLIPIMRKNFGATKWSQFEFEKTTFLALKRAIKVDILLIFCCFYTHRVTKTQRIRTEG